MLINLLLFILILGLVVLVHEFGHFIFAKLFKVKVFEFSIGMGPKVVSHTSKGGTKYSLRWIPLGGYVSLAGEDIDTDLKVNKGENLQDKPVWQRAIIMVMGVCFNFILAFVVLLISALISGSTSLDPVIDSAAPSYPAAEVGIEEGDKILKINNHKITYLDDVTVYLTVENLENDLTFNVLKENGEEKDYTFKAKKETKEDGSESYVVGISFDNDKEYGLLSSLSYSFKKEGAIFKQMYIVLTSLFTGKVSINELSGPVGIYSMVGTVRSLGVAAVLYLIALLCVNVGVINILPFPAFDGGKVLFLFIEKIKGSPVSPKVENTIHAIGFILLIILFVYVTFNDVLKLF